MRMLKKLIGTVWRCVANVYWTSMIVLNFPALICDLVIRTCTTSDKDLAVDDAGIKYYKEQFINRTFKG